MNQPSQENEKRTISRFTLVLLVALCLLGALLRAVLLNIGLTLDDACTASVVEAQNLAEMVRRIKEYEMSPPLYFLALKGLVTMAGINSVTMALPSFIFGTLTIPLTYLLTLTMVGSKHDKQAEARVCALLAAFFQAVSPLAIIYSHEARTYSLAGLLLSLVLLLYWQYFQGPVARLGAVMLFLAATALVYTHYTAIFYIGILMVLCLLYKDAEAKPSRAAAPALLPLALSLTTLIPWLPVLLYHKNVGTPWADPTPLSHFAHVMAGNLAAMMPLPVVPSYLIVLVSAAAGLLTLPFAVIKKMRGKAPLISPRLNSAVSFKVMSALLIVLISCAAYGYITPYMFGYVRYLSPLVPLTSALLATLLLSVCKGKLRKIVLICLLPACLAGSFWEVRLLAEKDRSGLRQIAREISAGRYKDAVFYTAPDFVGMILDFYLKHDVNLKAEQMPLVYGFTCPEAGTRPIKHEEDVAWCQVKDLNQLHQKLIDGAIEKGKTRLVLIRDTYKPTSKFMPVKELGDSFMQHLASRYTIETTGLYKGSAASYEVTVFKLKN